MTGSTRSTPSTPPARFVDQYLGYLLGQANHAMYRQFDALVRQAGLSSIEWRVLATLHDQPPMPVSCLAREVLSKQPTVTKLVQRMAAQGWVDLLADPADQRRTLVGITATGRRKVRPLIARARQHEQAVLGTLGEAGVRELKSLLRRLATMA